MRILTFLNVSNRSRMQADSGYIFYNLLSPYFTKQNSFYFASPEPLSDCNCIHINKEFGFNKYEVRFSFDWSKVMEIISKVSPDVLIVNQVEQVPHYKAIIQALGINVSIVSYAHYIPYLFVNNVFCNYSFIILAFQAVCLVSIRSHYIRNCIHINKFRIFLCI